MECVYQRNAIFHWATTPLKLHCIVFIWCFSFFFVARKWSHHIFSFSFNLCNAVSFPMFTICLRFKMASTRCLNYIYCKLFILIRARAIEWCSVFFIPSFGWLRRNKKTVEYVLTWMCVFWSIWRNGHKVMNLNVYRFMLKLFFMSYTTFILHFWILFLIFVRSFVHCAKHNDDFRFHLSYGFRGTLFCHYIIVITTRTHHHFELMHVNEWIEHQQTWQKKATTSTIGYRNKIEIQNRKVFC